MTSSTARPARPLDGVRVLELGQLIAGPFAGCILAYFGAEVIKIGHQRRAIPCGCGVSSSMVQRSGGAVWAAIRNVLRCTRHNRKNLWWQAPLNFGRGPLGMPSDCNVQRF